MVAGGALSLSQTTGALALLPNKIKLRKRGYNLIARCSVQMWFRAYVDGQ